MHFIFVGRNDTSIKSSGPEASLRGPPPWLPLKFFMWVFFICFFRSLWEGNSLPEEMFLDDFFCSSKVLRCLYRKDVAIHISLKKRSNLHPNPQKRKSHPKKSTQNKKDHLSFLWNNIRRVRESRHRKAEKSSCELLRVPNGVFQTVFFRFLTSACDRGKPLQRDKECQKTPVFLSHLVCSVLVHRDHPLNTPL